MSESEKPIDIDERHFLELYVYTMTEIEKSLANHAAFERYLKEHPSDEAAA